jgi:hypothetical protein
MMIDQAVDHASALSIGFRDSSGLHVERLRRAQCRFHVRGPRRGLLHASNEIASSDECPQQPPSPPLSAPAMEPLPLSAPAMEPLPLSAPAMEPSPLSFPAMVLPPSPLFAIEEDVEHGMAGRGAQRGVEEDVVEQLPHEVATVGNHGPEGENKEQVWQCSIWSIMVFCMDVI